MTMNKRLVLSGNLSSTRMLTHGGSEPTQSRDRQGADGCAELRS
jgi:hypothetical protein